MNAQPQHDDYLLLSHVARRLQCCPQSVARLIKNGRLRAAKVGRKYLIAPSDFAAFMESSANSTPRAPAAPVRSVAERRRALAKAERKLDAAGV